MSSHLNDWIKETFNNGDIVKLKSLVATITIDSDLKVESSKQNIVIVTQSAIRKPLVYTSDEENEYLQGFCVSRSMVPLDNKSILFNSNDFKGASMFEKNTNIDSYVDTGIGVIRAKDINTAFFLAWYLSIDEVVHYVAASSINKRAALMNLDVPSNIKVDSIFMKNLHSLFEAETRIMSNSEDMLLRLKCMRKKLLEEVGELCQL